MGKAALRLSLEGRPADLELSTMGDAFNFGGSAQKQGGSTAVGAPSAAASGSPTIGQPFSWAAGTAGTAGAAQASPGAPTFTFNPAAGPGSFVFGGSGSPPASLKAASASSGKATAAFSFGSAATPSLFGAAAPAPAPAASAVAPAAAAGGFSFGSAATPAPFGAAAPAPAAFGAAAPAAAAGGFTFSGAAPGGGGFSFSGSVSAPAAAFGSANAGLLKLESVSLQTAADVEGIASGLRGGHIAKLTLEGAAMDVDESPTIAAEGAAALASVLRASGGSLREVRLIGHRFDEASSVGLVLGGLEGCTGLQELELTNSSLTEDGGESLAAAIGSLPSLRVLLVEDCCLGDHT